MVVDQDLHFRSLILHLSLPDPRSTPGGVLLQVGLSLFNLDGEYRGGGVVEEVEENEGGGVSVE